MEWVNTYEALRWVPSTLSGLFSRHDNDDSGEWVSARREKEEYKKKCHEHLLNVVFCVFTRQSSFNPLL